MDEREVLAWLERRGSRRNVEGMARYGIVTRARVVGVSVGTLRQLAKQLGRDHAFALRLWDVGWYETRTLAALVDDPAQVTPDQMDAWAADLDNWAICDTVCFHLFDKSPHAWHKVEEWATAPGEFVRRAAFALMASLALHDKAAPDARFLPMLPLIERTATDGRNFVKKGVSWALRAIGRRSPALLAAAQPLARRLAVSADGSSRWIGKDALRDFRAAAQRARARRKAR